ncbi:MAG: DUF6159 family protein [Sandaracinus sp.]
MFSQYTHVFGFAKQVLEGARKKPVLFAPLVMNIALAVPVNALLIVVSMFVSDGLATMLMPVGLSALYFIDYFAGGLNTAMVYEEQTTGNATLGSAFKRTMKAVVGILVFAVVSGLLDFAVQVLSQRRLHMLRPLLQIIRSFWSTATFVIMPSMIIEGIGFGAAFKRSKELAEKDPTQIGVGYVGIGLATSLISMVGFVLVSFVGYRILWPISPLLGLAFSLVILNATWAIAAYLKSTYYTCFYMWTRECERHQGVNPAFAPAPLRNVLSGVDFGAMGIQLVPAAAAVAVAFAGAPAQPGFGPVPGGAGGPAPAPAAFVAPGPQPGPQFGAPAPQPQFGGPQSQFGGPQSQFVAPGPQPQGPFVAPAPQAQFVAPAPQPPPQSFGAPPPSQPQFAVPAPRPYPQPQPQFAAPAPQPYPQPQPQFAAPAPQPYPQPQPQFAAPAPQPYPQPQPQFAAPAPQPYPQPQPQFAAPAPQPYPQPQPQFAAPAPQPQPQVIPAPRPYPQPQPQPQFAAPAPQPYPQPHAVPAPRPYPQPQPQPAAQSPLHDAHPELDVGDLEGEATVMTPSPFDTDNH